MAVIVLLVLLLVLVDIKVCLVVQVQEGLVGVFLVVLLLL
jgi:hypothetical protein